MDKETLKQYRDLIYEIKRLEKRINKLKDSETIEHDRVTGSNSEFPYQPITVNIEGVADNSEKVKSLESILKNRKAKAEKQKLEVEEFISDIFDSRVRLIFEDRYIFGKSWIQISMRIGSCHESYARMIHDRYLTEIAKALDKK